MSELTCIHCGRWIEHRGGDRYWDQDQNAGCPKLPGFGHRPGGSAGPCRHCGSMVTTIYLGVGDHAPTVYCDTCKAEDVL